MISDLTLKRLKIPRMPTLAGHIPCIVSEHVPRWRFFVMQLPEHVVAYPGESGFDALLRELEGKVAMIDMRRKSWS